MINHWVTPQWRPMSFVLPPPAACSVDINLFVRRRSLHHAARCTILFVSNLEIRGSMEYSAVPHNFAMHRNLPCVGCICRGIGSETVYYILLRHINSPRRSWVNSAVQHTVAAVLSLPHLLVRHGRVENVS